MWAAQFIHAFHRYGYEPTPKVRETMFFPSDTSLHRLVQWLGRAQDEMLVCVFNITNNTLRDALMAAHHRGVKVRIITDDECMKQGGNDVQALRNYGIECEADLDSTAHMHNKYVVIDGKYLITGSFNWTVSAARDNNENLCVVDDIHLIDLFTEDFNSLWTKFKPGFVAKDEGRGARHGQLYRAN
jgi:cardiolipin hydrolase